MNGRFREKWIDNAKGIALICVIIGNINGGKFGEHLDLGFVYGFHLIVFCLLSGYTLKNEKLDTKYVNRMFIRLMVPYFVTCLCICLMDLWNHLFFEHDGKVISLTRIVSKDLLRSFFASGTVANFGAIEVGSGIGAIWWLPAMFFSLLILQLIFHFTEDRLRLGLITASLALLGNISARFIWFPFSVQSAMEMSFFIWIGYEVKRLDLLDKIQHVWYLVSGGIFLLWALRFPYSTIYAAIAHIKDTIISVIVALAECLIIYGISIRIKKFNGFSYIGENSLTFLCVHLFGAETVWRYMEAFTLRLFACESGSFPFYRWMLLWNLLFTIICGTIIIEGKKRYTLKRKPAAGTTHNTKRDEVTDIVRGILIISMLIGHNSIDPLLRKTIYSCHMIAFIFLSGIYYKQKENTIGAICHVVKSVLGPYGIFVLCDLVLHMHNASSVLLKDLAGISFTKELFTEIPSVGPVYFILILFLVRVMYILLDRVVKHPILKMLAVIGISWLGMKIGQRGCWLPWSFDVACYCLVFYYIAVVFKEKQLMESVKTIHIFYFILSTVWVYMIYNGGMEIAVRNYGPQYGMTIIGALCGALLIYKLAVYIEKNGSLAKNILRELGSCTVYVLIFHTLFNRTVSHFVARWFGPGYIFHFVFYIGLQLLTGWIIYKLVQQCERVLSVNQ